MDGILVVNKPTDMTSRDVVNILSKLFHTKKIGHAGTLDPIATGVLVICIGKYTKMVEILTGQEKEYEFGACLGVKTDTFDYTGNVLEEKEAIYTEEEIKTCLTNFPKTYLQEVPIYSAVRVNGKKLYEYARENEKVDLPKRVVQIKELRLKNFYLEKDKTYFEASVKVSKGTYIRSLITDIASSLNTIGMMTSLVRTKQGKFLLEDAYTLEQIENNEYSFIPLEECLTDYPTYELRDEEVASVKNGALIDKKYVEDKVVLTFEGKIIALYQTYEKDQTKMKPWKML